MSDILCTIIIPSRGHPEKLLLSVDAFYRNSKDARRVEVLVRADDDDPATIAAIPQVEAIHENTKVHVGPRHDGYLSIGRHVSELSALSRGQWVSQMDDDMTLDGDGWDNLLAEVPLDGKLVVHPEFYWLGKSRYGSGSCGVVAPFVPNGCWRQYGIETLASPVDQDLHDLLVVKHGWGGFLLKGITCNHSHWNNEPA